MEYVVGELFDQTQALKLVGEAKERGFRVEMRSLNTSKGTIYRLYVNDPTQADAAADFFRVRMGLPGPPPEVDPEWEKMRSIPMGQMTMILLGLSIAVFLTRFQPGAFEKVLSLFFINTPSAPFLRDVMAGEVWRLITPIFLHFGFLHIIFNGMWIKDLGSLFESQRGPKHFLLFVVIVSVSSNLLQYLAIGPRFGGLSGLVYGLLGYLWIYGRFHKDAEFRLPKRDVYLMIGWYFLCLLGMIGNIANIAHGAGLAVGMLWGLFPWEKGEVKQKVLMVLLAIFFSFGTYLIEIAKKSL